MYVMKPPKIPTEQTQFIFGLTEDLCAIDETNVGVEKRLTGGTEIVSRVVITRLRNSSGVIRERMSSDKLPSVNSRVSTV